MYTERLGLRLSLRVCVFLSGVLLFISQGKLSTHFDPALLRTYT